LPSPSHATEDELRRVDELALKTNQVLRAFLESKGLLLVDMSSSLAAITGRSCSATNLSGTPAASWTP